MKNIIFTICFFAVGLCLAFILFTPDVHAAGCCEILDAACTSSECAASQKWEVGEGWEGVSAILKGETATIKCKDAVSFDHCNSLAQEEGKFAKWESENCGDQWHCSAENPKLKEPYTPADFDPGTISKGIPEITITNPVCWPENECDAVCKEGNCWTGQETECESGRGYCLADRVPTELSIPIGGIGYVKDIGSYIALLYNYLIGALVIVAIVMIMYGGFRWITAAGSPEQISDAKRTIVGAVVGLALGLFSYTLLNVINPALLRLELPRIKRIRPIYFEIQKVSCQDYDTQVECEANPDRFNVQLNDEGEEVGGCFWMTTALGDKRCISALMTKGPGFPGDECLSGNKCNEGKCIQYDNIIKSYLSNPLIGQKEKWCTDGAFMMPCKYDTDCKQGLYCDENLWTCLPVGGGRTVGAECEIDGHCSSGFCSYGKCQSGKGGQSCWEGKECNEGQGYKCVVYDKDLKIGYCCDPYSAKLGGDRCFTSCKSDQACGEDFYCWNDLAAFLPQGGGETAKKNISDWIGVCFEKQLSGKYCVINDGCKSGTCSNYESYTATDTAVKKVLLAPGGQKAITFPEGYDRIQVGTCE